MFLFLKCKVSLLEFELQILIVTWFLHLICIYWWYRITQTELGTILSPTLCLQELHSYHHSYIPWRPLEANTVLLYGASAILHKQNTSWTRNNKLFCTNAVLTLLYWYYSLIPQVSEKVNCFFQVMLSILWKLKNKLNDRFKC